MPAKRNSRLLFIAASAAGGAIIGAVWAGLQHAHSTGPRFRNLHEFLADRVHAGFTPGILIAIALLCLFSLYWEAAAKNAAEAKTEEPRWSRAIHLTLLTAGQVLLIIPIPGLRARFLPQTTALVAVGVIVEAAFLAMAIWARQLLGRNWSAAVAIKVDQQLIRSGPYRIVRHPIYSAILGAYAGIAIISGEVHALVGLIVISLAYWRKIRLEEMYLSTVFGPAYDDYKNSTSALIPGIL